MAPGSYRALLSMGNHSDTMRMTVDSDPRSPFDEERHARGVALRKESEGQVARLAKLMQQLAEAKLSMESMDAVWTHLDDSTTMGLDSLSAQALEGIEEIQAMLWTPEDFVGYDHVTIRVMDQLYDAMPDVAEGETPNARRKLEIATSAVDRVEVAVQDWTDGPWQALMEEAQGLDVSLPLLYEAVRGTD